MPVSVHDDLEEARGASREQLATYVRSPFYQQMFADSGHPEAFEGVWSDGMLDDVTFLGDENTVADGLRGLFAAGATEVIAHPIIAGDDADASWSRTVTCRRGRERRHP